MFCQFVIVQRRINITSLYNQQFVQTIEQYNLRQAQCQVRHLCLSALQDNQLLAEQTSLGLIKQTTALRLIISRTINIQTIKDCIGVTGKVKFNNNNQLFHYNVAPRESVETSLFNPGISESWNAFSSSKDIYNLEDHWNVLDVAGLQRT
ncbi:unnamed protein product [Clavelina lepadiformis]|uniref:Uncharacterized protein n=1 Tax=Clavelina lepadiformis TaxID=159417 RepID=A0ABP0G6J8_CLALP